MNSQADIEKLLERLGSEWPDDGSIVESVMQEVTPIRRNSKRYRRRFVMKISTAIAASVAIAVSLWWGLSGGNSLYAEVMAAVRKARTIHSIQYVQPKDADEPVKVSESWYERGVGYRLDQPTHVRLGNEECFWTFDKERQVATRFQSGGIKEATESMFSDIDQLARRLEDDFERYPKGDRSIQGRTCRAYLLAKLDRYADQGLKDGRRRMFVFVDEESRPVRAAIQSRDGDQWRTESFSDCTYDEPIDASLFQPSFGDGVKIVDADKAFDAFADPASAVHREERDGLIYAIHRVERFENGGVLVVSSVRGTKETLKEFPLTSHRFRPGVHVVHGPAERYQASPLGGGFIRHNLAFATHQGIEVFWWVLLPRNTPPNHFEVSPGRIKLNVGVTPQGEYAKARHADEQGVIHYMTWDVELDVPRPAKLPTLKEIAGRVHADLVTLDSVPVRFLLLGDRHEGKSSDVDEMSSAEYSKATAKMIRSWSKFDFDDRLTGPFDRATLEPKDPNWTGGVSMWFRYEPLLDDSTLERIAKHESLESLDLRGTRISDDGLGHLAGLKKLETLDLVETGITDAGLVHLEGLSSLKKLLLVRTGVTEDGVGKLKQALPNVTIEWQSGKP